MKKTLLPIAMILMLLSAIVPASVTATRTATIYATAEEGNATYWDWFHISAPYATGTEDKAEAEYAVAGCCHLRFFHVLALSELDENIKTIKPSALTITYYGSANVSDKAKFCLWMVVCNETCKLAWIDETYPALNLWGTEGLEGLIPEYNITSSCVAHSSLIQTTNQSLRGYYSIVDTVPVEPEWYAIVEWGINKTDITALKADLYFDAQHSPLYPTKIDNIRYDTSVFIGSLGSLWYIILPILYLIGVSLFYVKGTERKPTLEEIIILAIGFFLVSILVPMGINIIYAS